jgi:hypothetical protein
MIMSNEDRRRRALAFALAGVSWDLIAEQCHYEDREEAIQDIELALAENPIDSLTPTATKALNLARLSRLLAGVWAPAINGNNRSVEVASSLIRQIMKAQGIEESRPGTGLPEHSATTSAYDELAARRPGTVNGPRRDGNGRRRGRRG